MAQTQPNYGLGVPAALSGISEIIFFIWIRFEIEKDSLMLSASSPSVVYNLSWYRGSRAPSRPGVKTQSWEKVTLLVFGGKKVSFWIDSKMDFGEEANSVLSIKQINQ